MRVNASPVESDSDDDGERKPPRSSSGGDTPQKNLLARLVCLPYTVCATVALTWAQAKAKEHASADS